VRLKPPLLSLGLISASTLAYEILLMRLFSVIQWHHFAYMIISLAILGYGISGTLVALLQQTLKRYFFISYPLFLLLFSISSFSCFFLAQGIPFNPEAILWDGWQIVYLISIFLVLTIPFVLAASAICLLFIQYPDQIAKIYGIDLLGAGLGSAGTIVLLFFFFAVAALFLISLIGLVAVLVAVQEMSQQHKAELSGVPAFTSMKLMPCRYSTGILRFFSLISIITGLVLISSVQYLALEISPYKDLSKILNIKGAQIIEQHSSPLGLLSIVESPQIPFRFAPGLSLHNTQEPPPPTINSC